MLVRQAVLVEPHKVEIREANLPEPGPNQILVATEVSAVSAGTELAVWTGTHQWLHDPNMPDWKFPFRPGYSAAGRIVAVGAEVKGWQAGDRIAYPGNHASGELLTVGHERGRWWLLPQNLDTASAAWACIARYGMGGAIRIGPTLGRATAVLGLGVIGQFALRCLRAAGAFPLVGIDGIAMRREAALQGGADHVIDPATGDTLDQLRRLIGKRGAEVVIDATGVPDAIPQAMTLADSGGQVVIVGSPRGRAKEVNFYDDLHRRYLEVTGAHGNMLFEPDHVRIPGTWDINKAQYWLLAALATDRLSLRGLVSHVIAPTDLGRAYEGLMQSKEEFLGVAVRW
jgi:2-desacetyl-2-hydroxyethyl bacteriochlorophyllide A dehydrogenase